MPVLTPTFDPHIGIGQNHWKQRVRPSIERLASAQLRSGSLYTNLRTCVPVLVLAFVWLIVANLRSFFSFHQLLSRSITVRHALLAIGIIAAWNLRLSLAVYQKKSPKVDLIAELTRLLGISFACSLLLLVGNLTRGQYRLGLVLALWTVAGLLLTSYILLGAFVLAGVVSRRVLRRRTAIIVGTGSRAELLKERLQSQYSKFELLGSVDEEYVGDEAGREGYLGHTDILADLLKTHPIEIVFIGLPIKSKYDEIQRVIDVCETVGVESHYMQDVFETSRYKVQTHAQTPHSLCCSWHTDPPTKANHKALY